MASMNPSDLTDLFKSTHTVASLHPIYSTYLGFWADSELYDRSGTVHTLAIGSLLIALTDIPIDKISDEFRDILSLLKNQNSDSDRFFYSEEISQRFMSACFDAYESLSSHHIILGDAFLSFFCDRLFNCSDPVRMDRLELSYSINDFSSFPACFDMLKRCSRFSYDIASFSDPMVMHNLMDSFFMLKTVDPYIFSLILEDESRNLITFFDDIRQQRDYFSTLISSILARTDNPSLPIFRYIDHSSLLDNPPCSNRKPSNIDRIQTIQKRVIKDPSADKYEEAQGYRLIDVYSTYGIYDAAMAEFYFMCTNNIDLGKCKHCGKFFRPLSIASNFCDRPLGGNSKHTCRSTSGRWYSDNRRSNNPAWNEFMKYKSKYNSRTTRNKHLNPPERFNNWKIKASALVDQYENSEISLDTFSKKLKEMDEDMKPLDKM